MVSLTAELPSGHSPPARGLQLYPLQSRLAIAGIVGAVAAAVLQDWAIAAAVFCLFAMVGALWRADMLPILPASLAFQWLSATSCYVYFHNYGRVPGGGFAGGLVSALFLSMVGLAALVAGLRLGLWLLRRPIVSRTLAPPVAYDIRKVFFLTVAVFGVSYVFDVLPKTMLSGSAQFITTLLALRFVPFFVLLVTVFERRTGYRYAAMGTLWVMGPQLLTGFSSFKEVLLVIIVAALAQWRPWLRTPEQVRQNRRILGFGVIGAFVTLAAALVWSGGVKQQWRQVVWGRAAQESPLERLGEFGGVVRNVLSDFHLDRAAEALAARSSSGELYFSYVLVRVPSSVPFENGRLFARAVANATVPRFLFPEKANLGGDSWLVRRYAGIAAAGDERGASIGLGYLSEFYVDFGVPGLIGLSLFWGLLISAALAALAWASPSREIFLAAAVGLLTRYGMVFDASFIKLLAGLLQHAVIIGAVLGMSGPLVQRSLLIRDARVRK